MEKEVRIIMHLSVDSEEYIMPSDGDVTEEISDALKEYFHDISGIVVKYIRVSQGD